MPAVRKLRPLNFVKCHKCSHLVPLSTTEQLPDEFTVRCPNCSHRSFYRTGEIRSGDTEQAMQDTRSPSAAEKASALRKATKHN